MGRLIVSTQMTLDSVIDVGEWYIADGEHDRAGKDQLRHASAVLLGRKTYEGLLDDEITTANTDLLAGRSFDRTVHRTRIIGLVVLTVAVLLAILTAGMGILRWAQVDRAMRRDLPLPRHPTPVYLGVGLVLIGLFTLGLVIAKAVTG